LAADVPNVVVGFRLNGFCRLNYVMLSLKLLKV
jgi:hypothetical protein